MPAPDPSQPQAAPDGPDAPDAAADTATPAGEVPVERGRPRPARRGYLLPGAIALVALAAIAAVINAAGLQHHDPKTLAGPDVATYIAQGIQAGVGNHTLPQVRCPASEPVRVGVHFTCTEQSAKGAPVRALEVTETTGSGIFTWHFAPS